MITIPCKNHATARELRRTMHAPQEWAITENPDIQGGYLLVFLGDDREEQLKFDAD